MLNELDLDPNPPPGLILHVASEAVGGINILEIWRTPESAENFVESRLRGMLERYGSSQPLAYRIEPTINLFAPELDFIERAGATSLPPRESVIQRRSA